MCWREYTVGLNRDGGAEDDNDSLQLPHNLKCWGREKFILELQSESLSVKVSRTE